MIPFLIALPISVMYIVIVCRTYRASYRRHYTEYLRWQNAHPTRKLTLYGRSPYEPDRSRARKDVTWDDYRRQVCRDLPTTAEALSWPVLVWWRPLSRWLHPEVEIPSLAKIDELEELTRE